jgi:hypothetical protein
LKIVHFSLAPQPRNLDKQPHQKLLAHSGILQILSTLIYLLFVLRDYFIRKHSSEYQKVKFLTHLNYTTISKATKLAGLEYFTAKSFCKRVDKLEVKYTKKGLPLLTWKKKLAKKSGNRAKPKLTNKNVNLIFKKCTLNRK